MIVFEIVSAILALVVVFLPLILRRLIGFGKHYPNYIRAAIGVGLVGWYFQNFENNTLVWLLFWFGELGLLAKLHNNELIMRRIELNREMQEFREATRENVREKFEQLSSPKRSSENEED